jgi:hypothetical protein
MEIRYFSIGLRLERRGEFPPLGRPELQYRAPTILGVPHEDAAGSVGRGLDAVPALRT